MNTVSKLIQALKLADFGDEDIMVARPDQRALESGYEPTDIIVQLTNTPIGTMIGVTISVDSFGRDWLYVNYSNENGDFTACAGTVYIERAMMDLGICWSQANQTKR